MGLVTALGAPNWIHISGEGFEMSKMIDLVTDALVARWKIGAHPAMSPDLPYWREMARTAIEAMREPTDEMTRAVENDAVIQGGLDDCNQHDIPENAWKIMIDAALISDTTSPSQSQPPTRPDA